MCVNIGHGDKRVIRAIQAQAGDARLRQPVHGDRGPGAPRRQAGDDHAGRPQQLLLHHRRRRSQRERHQGGARVTGRQKIIARYRSYHGGTVGAITLTGDPRRWAAEPGIPGVVRVPDFYHGVNRAPWTPRAEALDRLEEVIKWEGPQTIAAIIIETVTGTNGIIVPPDGYLEGIRALCDKHGILLIADEVMCGFGRTGAWFAIDHWGVVPDMLTMAKGLTSAYVPLGAVGCADDRRLLHQSRVRRRPDLQRHPLACAAAVATSASTGRSI